MNKLLHKTGRIIGFYADGFRNMSWWGRRVWIIILIKLLIIFLVLKIFFFRDFLDGKFNNDKQKSEYIRDQLINSKQDHDRESGLSSR